MHPAIRIISFLVILGVLVHAQFLTSLMTLIATLLIFPGYIQSAIVPTWRLLWRLKWLLLAVAVLYLMMTPGRPIFESHVNGPSHEGITMVAQRLMAWMTIIYLYVLFSLRTSSVQWQSGLFWLLKFLTANRFSYERFIVRMALTLRSVDALRQHAIQPNPASARRTWRDSLLQVRTVILDAHTFADHVEPAPIEIEELVAPEWIEWGYPLLLLATLISLNTFVP